MKSVPWLMLALLAVAYGALLSCEGDHGHDHPHGEEGHSHGEGSGDHGHPHGDPKKDDTHGGPNDHHGAHGGAVDAHGHGHGHGHEGASEVVTRWGRTTQLFVEFPALVVGEDSPFAAHLTRLQDHFAIDKGKVVVELSGGNLEKEYFSIDRPAIAGIFRPIVRPAKAGKRRITLRLDSVEAAEVHDLGEFTVYASRKQADAAAKDDADPPGTISYLLEQQWKVPFRVEHVEARHMRPNFTAFARLVLPSDAEAVVTAPRDGRVTPAAGRFPIVGETFATDGVLFALSSAPVEGVGPATLDLGVEQATIRVEAAKREVNRLTPLVEQGVVAQRRLDDANSALAQAQAELRSARRRRGYLGQSQRIKKLGARDGLAVPSPIAGSIAELYVAPGAWVNKGDKLARIVNRDALWLDVGVPEAYVGRLGQVSGAWFHLDNVYGVIEVPRSAPALGGDRGESQDAHAAGALSYRQRAARALRRDDGASPPDRRRAPAYRGGASQRSARRQRDACGVPADGRRNLCAPSGAPGHSRWRLCRDCRGGAPRQMGGVPRCLLCEVGRHLHRVHWPRPRSLRGPPSMIDGIIRWSLKNRLFVLLGALGLMIWGAIQANEAPVDVFPDLSAPTVTVVAEAHGMAPEEVERLIAFPVESALNGASGVRRVRSNTSVGVTVIYVQFEWGTDIYTARQVVAEKLQLVQPGLPPDIAPPVLAPISSIMGEILFIGLVSDSDLNPREVRTIADWEVRRRLLAVPGVAQVVPIGGGVQQFQVLVRPQDLVKYGVTLDDVVNAVSATNENTSAGFYEHGGQEYLIYGVGRVGSVEDIAEAVVLSREEAPRAGPGCGRCGARQRHQAGRRLHQWQARRGVGHPEAARRQYP